MPFLLWRTYPQTRLQQNSRFHLLSWGLSVVLLVGRCSYVFAQSQPEPNKNSDRKTPAHFARIHGERKLGIHPTIPADGIRTGIVMAYGHIIHSPYRIEYTDGRLLINGVQVEPSLILAQEPRYGGTHSAALDKIDYDKGSRIVKQAQELYSREIQSKSLDAVQAEIVDFINKSTDVYVNPKWVGKKSLRVQFAGSQIQDRLEFSESPPVQLNAEEARRREDEGSRKAKEFTLSGLRKNLETGNVVAFGSAGTQVVMRDPRKKIIQIMGTPGLSKEQQAEMIYTQIISDYDFALDVTANYDSAEWQIK